MAGPLPKAMLNFERLDGIAESRAAEFASAEPYPHVVIDDFLPASVAEEVWAEFAVTKHGWTHYHHYNEKKLALTDTAKMGPATRDVFDALMSDRFVGFVQRLTGIEGLISDPDLDGAGMHQIMPGGFLNVHTDFLSHTKHRHWSRQVNLLIYFNKNWHADWMGDLELWDADMSRCVRSVAPTFNRCVLFHTRKRSFHGHPHKLACPEGESRKSVALYYFRNEGSVRELSPTNYQPLPDDPPVKKALVAADRTLLRAYSWMKRYTGLTDGAIDRFLRRF
ncbi:MAG: 2OG-Fe(II) oxygenase family protein [Alphaproteobacteria bacterium]|nr:2OG-Fe(II) oxygenase family protein [Alphaproteobacteria bacterium]